MNLRDQLTAILDALRELFPGTEAREPQLVVAIDHSALTDNPLKTLQLTITAANKAQKLSKEPLRVKDAIVFNGPRGDGVTPNTGPVMLGDGIADGVPLPTAGIGLGPKDLSKVLVVSATANDVVRVLYEL